MQISKNAKVLKTLTFLFMLLLSSSQKSIFWLQDSKEMRLLKHPFEVISRFGLQNGVNLRDQAIEKKVLRVGLRYDADDQATYVIVLKMEGSQGRIVYVGAEYLPQADGLFFDNG